jgi:hypothetical protein
MGRFEGDRGGRPPATTPVGPPIVEDKRCLVCKSQYRKDMERLLVVGLSYSEIARYFEALGEEITRKSLSNHREKHMWVETAAIRGLIEEKARAAMLDVEEHKGFLTTKHGVLETLLQQGYRDILSGITKVEAKDMLAIIEKLQQMEREEKSVAVDEMIAEFNAFADAVKAVCSPEQWKEIYRRFDLLLETRKHQPLEQLITLDVTEEPPPPRELPE